MQVNFHADKKKSCLKQIKYNKKIIPVVEI